MKQLFALANAYIGSRDWKMLALVKFCLVSLGLLLGLNVPARHRKTVFWSALTVFLSTWSLLMADFGSFSRKYWPAHSKDR